MTDEDLAGREPASLTSGVTSQSDEKPAAKTAGGVRNSVFAQLVEAEDDTVGLLGYAVYKQNKRDWLVGFLKEHNREVTEGELEAYHLGERSPRRVLTYRRLAVDVLARDPGGREGQGLAAGQGHTVNYVGGASAASGRQVAGPPSFAEAILARGWSTILVAVLALFGVLAVVILALSLINPGVLRQILP